MMTKLLRRIKSDEKGEAIASGIFFTFLSMVILMTMLDGLVWSLNKSAIQQIVTSGAQSVRIVAGDGTADQQTSLERSYGIAKPAGTLSNESAIEGQVRHQIENSRGVIGVTIDKIECGPTVTERIGQEVWCTAEYTYHLGVLSLSGMMWDKNVATGTTTSEVAYSSGLVNRLD